MIAVTIGLLVKDVVAPSAAVFGATVILLVAGVIDVEQALSGFSNPAPITVAALYVLASAVERTGAVQPIVNASLGDVSGERRALTRLLLPTAAVSGFLNNTPIVAILAPQVSDWAERRGLSPSKFLMPLSFAAILGGMVTLIGTSTNLVVSGLLEASGRPPLGMFEITRVGLPVALVGLVTIIGTAPGVLPARRSARRDLENEVRQFVVDMVVLPGGSLDGSSVAQGHLRHLQGVYLVQIEREDQLIAPVSPQTVLRGGDLLRFVGQADLVVDLQSMRGLVSAEQTQLKGFDAGRSTFFEAVVGPASPLVGRTLQEIEFRSRYQAAVVAIHRAGQRVEAKLGEVRLRTGDTLLMLADPGFRDRWYDRSDFLLVSRLGGNLPASTGKAAVVALVGLGIVVVAGAGLIPLVHAALSGAILLVLLGVLTAGEARAAVDLDVIVLIAAAFGIGAAIESSGLAGQLGTVILNLSEILGPRGPLLGVILATLVLTELITNNAAAVLIFPVALSVSQSLGIEPHGMAVVVAVTASASFLTPIGYQTNTMVYGPGGYRFGDYVRLGAPLTLMTLVAVILAVPLMWPA